MVFSDLLYLTQETDWYQIILTEEFALVIICIYAQSGIICIYARSYFAK